MKTLIIEALTALGYSGSFRGPEPSLISDITDAYLSSTVTVKGIQYTRLTLDSGSVTAAEIKSKLIEMESEGNLTDIKQAAGAVINSYFPEWQQRNYMARAIELTSVVASGGTLSDLETQELADSQVRWDWVKSVREASDQAEIENTPVGDIVWPPTP
jgi:hypothetical protein